jgi:hypothetical protein
MTTTLKRDQVGIEGEAANKKKFCYQKDSYPFQVHILLRDNLGSYVTVWLVST